MATIERITDAEVGLDRCAELVRSDPVGCNLVAGTLAHGGEVDLLRAHEGDRTLGAAVAWGPGFTLTRLRDGAAEAIADALPSEGRRRLDGEARDVATVAGRWSERTAGSIETIEIFRVYRLGELTAPDVAGATVVADADHVDTAANWAVTFAEETGLSRDDVDAEAKLATTRAQMTRAADQGRLRTWRVGGEVVSQLLVSTACFGTVRIGAVYTPPAHRGNGYASALTAAVADGERSRPDVDVVMLTTQASNALTNRLYRRLGFESVYEMLLVWLVAGPTPR